MRQYHDVRNGMEPRIDPSVRFEVRAILQRDRVEHERERKLDPAECRRIVARARELGWIKPARP